MPLIVYLLLCFSLHACNARNLGFMDNGTSREIQVPGMLKPLLVSEELRTEDTLRAETDERKPYDRWGGADTMKQKDSKSIGKEDKDIKGNDIIVHSSRVGMQDAAKHEGWKRQARSMIGFLAHDDPKETIDTTYKENNIVQDIEVMDYAQPHRKPPIHNREP